jgi:phosphopantetheinyl transferase (holo-ACP synthase)
MISAGNDIVSFAATNPERTKQPQFYNKILNQTETVKYEELYSTLLPFEVYIWLLWSVKEAAYKYLKRLDAGLVFSPTKFIIDQLLQPACPLVKNFGEIPIEGAGFDNSKTWAGVVNYGSHTLYFRSLLYSEMVHSVVNHSGCFDDVHWGIQTIHNTESSNQSEAVRVFLLERLQSNFTGRILEVGKDPQDIPVALVDQGKIQLPVSFSHHGQFVGYCFCK